MTRNAHWSWMVATVIWAGLLMLLAQHPTAHCASAPTPEEIRSRVSQEVDYTLDQEVDYDIVADTSLRMRVKDNRFGIAEVLIYPQSGEGLIWVGEFDAAGKPLVFGSREFKTWDGSICQIGALPCAAITKWRVSDKTFRVRFIISTDRSRNRDEIEAVRQNSDRKTAGYRIAMTNTDDTFYLLPLRISRTYRLAGFIRFWTEVKYNFAFFERMPDLDWDQVLVDYLPRIDKAEMSLAEYGDIMEECAALLKDGHTGYFGMNSRGGACPPVRIRSVGGKAIIEEVRPDAVKDAETRNELVRADLKPGEEIVEVDGLAVKERLEKNIYPHTCASTPQGRDLRAYSELLRGDLNSTVALTIRDASGGLREVKLKRTSYVVPGKPNEFVFKKIGDDIGYVNLPTFGDKSVADEFDKLASQLQGLKGLILDVRQNGGGDDAVGERIISHLIETPLKRTLWKTRQYRPAFRAWGEKDEWYRGEPEEVEPADDKYFLGSIVLLTGPATVSAAEDFTVVLHAGKRVTIVGERTNGSTGQPLLIDLPMRAEARICTKWDTYPDGREFVGVGIIPDVEIGPTPEDIAQGRDAVLDKGIEVLRGLMERE